MDINSILWSSSQYFPTHRSVFLFRWSKYVSFCCATCQQQFKLIYNVNKVIRSLRSELQFLNVVAYVYSLSKEKVLWTFSITSQWRWMRLILGFGEWRAVLLQVCLRFLLEKIKKYTLHVSFLTVCLCTYTLSRPLLETHTSTNPLQSSINRGCGWSHLLNTFYFFSVLVCFSMFHALGVEYTWYKIQYYTILL